MDYDGWSERVSFIARRVLVAASRLADRVAPITRSPGWLRFHDRLSDPGAAGGGRMASALFGLSVALCAAGQAVEGQAGPQVSLIEDSPTICKDCIRITRELSVGQGDGEGFLVPHGELLQDRSGQYWALQRAGPKVFAVDGSYVGTVGRRGAGPEEFNDVSAAFVDSSGLIHVFDAGNLRESVLGEDLSFRLTRRTPGIVIAAVEADSDSYLANMLVYTPEALGLPIHRVENGQVVRSFGAAQGRTSRPMRTVLLAQDHRRELTYSVEKQDFEVHVWDQAGQRLRVLRRPGYLRPSPSKRTRGRGRRAEIVGVVAAIRIDSRGRLWVSSWLPRADWRERAREVRRRDGRLGYRWNSPADVFEGVIEIIDLEESNVVARAVLRERVMYGFLHDGRVFGPVQTNDGEYWIDISAVQFTPRELGKETR